MGLFQPAARRSSALTRASSSTWNGFHQIVVGALLHRPSTLSCQLLRAVRISTGISCPVAQGLDQLHARHLRQAEIDDAHVERHFATHVQTFLAVLGRVHREAFALQARGKGFTQGASSSTSRIRMDSPLNAARRQAARDVLV